MRKSSTLVVASVVGVLFANAALAQPRPYNEAWRPQLQAPPPPPGDHREPGRHEDGRPPGAQRSQSYYYNGRWVDQNEWQRRSPERDRWARNYQRRHKDHDGSDSAALIASIIGFALGAAIVGSVEQAEHARSADESWDQNCGKKYRSYDRSSRTYMGYDGLRHYCR